MADKLISFDKDTVSRVAILQGKGGCFCAGADLKAVSGDVHPDKILQIVPVEVTGRVRVPQFYYYTYLLIRYCEYISAYNQSSLNQQIISLNKHYVALGYFLLT